MISFGMRRFRTITCPHGNGEDWRVHNAAKMKQHDSSHEKQRCHSRIFSTMPRELQGEVRLQGFGHEK